uniref:AC6 n=1 Tax=Tomato leaf curl New Delhi virus TaxID=223347 RepID=A0A2D1P851_9GEMI|nr:AC6 [Tomato leaf curl New Delhi virus]
MYWICTGTNDEVWTSYDIKQDIIICYRIIKIDPDFQRSIYRIRCVSTGHIQH